MAASIHKGHRERLKQRFLEEGLDNFTDIQVLELLLFYAIPQKDTNPIAHGLLEHFGSLARVLKTPTATIVLLVGAVLLLELSFRKEKQKKSDDLELIKEEIRRLKEEQESAE